MKELDMKKTFLAIAFLVLALFVVPSFAQAQQQKATKQLSLTVAAQLAITTASPLPAAAVGVAYSQQLVSTGGTGAITWGLTVGAALPAGMTLSTAGLLAGTPTTGGTFVFSVTATDSGGQTSSLQIDPSKVVASK
jgi:Zn-dependent protease